MKTKPNVEYHVPRGRPGHNTCRNCVMFDIGQCTRECLPSFVKPNGTCNCFVDKMTSWCLKCANGSEFDGRLTKCDEHHSYAFARSYCREFKPREGEFIDWHNCANLQEGEVCRPLIKVEKIPGGTVTILNKCVGAYCKECPGFKERKNK